MINDILKSKSLIEINLRKKEIYKRYKYNLYKICIFYIKHNYILGVKNIINNKGLNPNKNNYFLLRIAKRLKRKEIFNYLKTFKNK